MKKRFLKTFLKVLGILFALFGILFLITYTQLWNSHVDVSVRNTGEFPLSIQQRLDDFEYLYKVLKENYPYFEVKKRQYGSDWLFQKEEFKDRIMAAKSDKEYYEVLDGILMLLQNGHTNIIQPGSEFDRYKKLYAGPQPWGQVYENSKVSLCYNYWKTVISRGEPSTIPIAFRYIEGHYYASKNLINSDRETDELGVPMGSKLLEVNGVNIDLYIKSLIGQRLLRLDPVRNKLKLNLFSIHTDTETELTLALPSGVVEKTVLKPYRPDALDEVGRTLPEHLYSADILEIDKVAYLKLPSFASAYVEKDRQGIRMFLEKIRDYSAIIIDIRGNTGGSTNYWMNNIVPFLSSETLSTRNYLLFKDSEYIKPFIKQKLFLDYFKLKPLKDLSLNIDNPGFYYADQAAIYEELEYVIKPNPVGFKGKIILLVDDNVYSSAEALAVFAKNTGWATLVGTRTGGDGIGFDPIPVALPYSGLVVRFPVDMGLNPDGSINEEIATEPDIYVEQSYQDFINRIKAESRLSEKLSVKDGHSYDTILNKAMKIVSER